MSSRNHWRRAGFHDFGDKQLGPGSLYPTATIPVTLLSVLPSAALNSTLV